MVWGTVAVKIIIKRLLVLARGSYAPPDEGERTNYLFHTHKNTASAIYHTIHVIVLLILEGFSFREEESAGDRHRLLIRLSRLGIDDDSIRRYHRLEGFFCAFGRPLLNISSEPFKIRSKNVTRNSRKQPKLIRAFETAPQGGRGSKIADSSNCIRKLAV